MALYRGQSMTTGDMHENSPLGNFLGKLVPPV